MKAILISILTLAICHCALSTEVPAPGATTCGNTCNPASPIVHIYNACNNCPVAKKPTPPIPSGYIVHPGLGAYKLRTDAGLTWNEARHACLKEGAHLAVITSALEDTILRDMQNAKKLQYVWLGFHSQFKKDDWVSVFDQELSTLGYAHWRVGEPNNLGGNERCVCSTDSGMNDLDCGIKLAFFCKIDLRQ